MYQTRKPKRECESGDDMALYSVDNQKHTHQKKDNGRITDRGAWGPVAFAARTLFRPVLPTPCFSSALPLLLGSPSCWLATLRVMLGLPHVSGEQDNEQQEPAFLSWNPHRRPHSHRKMKEKVPVPSPILSFLSPSFPPSSSRAPHRPPLIQPAARASPNVLALAMRHEPSATIFLCVPLLLLRRCSGVPFLPLLSSMLSPKTADGSVVGTQTTGRGGAPQTLFVLSS
jgi:hypothetical protein